MILNFASARQQKSQRRHSQSSRLFFLRPGMLNHGLKRETTLSHLFQKIASKRIRIAEAERFDRVAVSAGHGGQEHRNSSG